MIRFSTLSDVDPTTVVVGTGGTQQSYTRTEYRDFAWSLLLEVESVERGPYLDNAQNQKVTIGVGFNVEGNNDIMAATLRSLGFDPTDTKVIGGQTKSLREVMTTAAIAIPNNTPDGTDPNDTTTVLGKMTDALRGFTGDTSAEFRFPVSDGTAAGIDAIYRPVWDFSRGGFEAGIDNRLADIPPSRERAVLLSLAYQSGAGSTGFLGPKLLDAIADGDRAEAWYEIRYDTNSDYAQRMYLQSHIFGLYDGVSDSYAPTHEEALKAFRMFTKHEVNILAYDAAHHSTIAGANANLTDIEGNLSDRGGNDNLGTVQGRADSLEGAFTHLRAWYATIRDALSNDLKEAGFTTTTSQALTYVMCLLLPMKCQRIIPVRLMLTR
jgi:hypothetical protein